MKKQIIKTATFTSNLKDFKGYDWQVSYFELLSWKNTWNRAIVLDIKANTKHEPFLYLVVKERDSELARNLLESLGYGNIKEEKTKTLEVDVDWSDDLDEVVAYFD